MCKIQIPEGASLDEKRGLCFDALYEMNLGDKIEKKDNLSYLTWSEAWKAFKEIYPSATFRVICNSDTKLPYFVDPQIGIMVFTEITIDGITSECFLPVMDYKNQAMKLAPYTYQVWDSNKKAYVDKNVEAATMFDINKTIWRCLVKNVAIATGIGLYIFKGEDVPEKSNEDTASSTKQQKKSAAQPTPKPFDKYAGLKATINEATDVNALMSLYLDHEAEITANPQLKQLLTARKLELQTPKAA